MVVRKNTKAVNIGGVTIGNNAPVLIQSMTNTRTEDVNATVEQILKLENAGCDIVRCSVYNNDCAKAINSIKERIHIPLVADVHFDYRLAIAAVENGADKLRINPGNIDSTKLKDVVDCAKAHHIPIRVGVNMGSLDKNAEQRFGRTAQALVESAMTSTRLLTDLGFYDIVISVKASDVVTNIEAYRSLSSKTDFPLHIGVTEAGTKQQGIIKNAVGIGTLLMEGIVDTLRVSLTFDTVDEIEAAKGILRSAGLYKQGVEIVSCPTCGRTRIDVQGIAEQVRLRTAHIKKPLKIAVMGCVVNGPGEAGDADIGIAGGDGRGALFMHGKLLRIVDEADLLDELLQLVVKL